MRASYQTDVEPSGVLRGPSLDVPQTTIHELVLDVVRAQPDAAAISWRGSVVTYRWLGYRSRLWASAFLGAGLDPADPVGITLDRSPDMIAAMLGVLLAGGCYVPLDPAYPDERLKLMATDAGVRIAAGHGLPDASGVVQIDLDHELSEAQEPSYARRRAVSPNQTAYVLYTSGSTGRPKGIDLTHHNAVDLLTWCHDAFGSDLELALASTSISFDCSILEIFGPLTCGGEVVLADGPTDHSPLTDGRGARLAHSVPSVLRELLLSGSLPETLSTLILGGEALDRPLADAVHSNGVGRLMNLYGPAECTSYASAAEVPIDSDDAPAIGSPVANTTVVLLDETWNGVDLGLSGEIAVSATGLAQGYRNRRRDTALSFQPCPLLGGGQRRYRTGDLASVQSGQLHFEGRVDDQVKIDGVRVEIGEVEAALRSAIGTESVAVVAFRRGPVSRLAGFAVGPDGREREVIASLHDHLPGELVPSQIHFLSALPYLPSGKLDRSRLTEIAKTSASAISSEAPTRRERQHDPLRTLVQAWGHELGTDLAPDTDVLHAGATSLTVLRVVNALRQVGLELAPSAIFLHPTIADHSTHVEPTGEPRPVNESWADPRALPLTPNQQRALKAEPAARTMPLAVRIAGPLNVSSVAAAWNTVGHRQTALRASLRQAAVGPPIQVVHEAAPDLLMVDLSNLDPALSIEATLPYFFERPTPPPTACAGAILRLSADDHTLTIAGDSVFLDTWSIETLGHQLLAEYVASSVGSPPQSIDELDYRSAIASPNTRDSADPDLSGGSSWEARLQDLPVLRLSDRSRLDQWSTGHALFTIEPTLTRRIDAAATATGTTPYMLILTALRDLLSEVVDDDRLAIGCPMSGRYGPADDQLCGPLTDATVFVCERHFGSSRDRLLDIRDTVVDAFDGIGTSFAELADMAVSDGSAHPVYQVSLGMQGLESILNPVRSGNEIEQQNLGALSLEPIRVGSPTTHLDLEIALFRRPDDFEGVTTFREDVLTHEQTDAMMQGFVTAIEDLIVGLEDACLDEPPAVEVDDDE